MAAQPRNDRSIDVAVANMLDLTIVSDWIGMRATDGNGAHTFNRSVAEGLHTECDRATESHRRFITLGGQHALGTHLHGIVAAYRRPHIEETLLHECADNRRGLDCGSEDCQPCLRDHVLNDSVTPQAVNSGHVQRR